MCTFHKSKDLHSAIKTKTYTSLLLLTSPADNKRIARAAGVPEAVYPQVV
jgi:hypothetical protein